jgi:uncharacterized OB-fold protein
MTTPTPAEVAIGPVLTSATWWEATAEGRLLLLRCPVCSTTWLPWMPYCPECGPASVPYVIESGGRGSLYSWVVIHYSVSAEDKTPFTVGSVLLEEGAMIYGRLTADAAASPRADTLLVAVFAQRDGRTVVDFAPR